MANALIARVEVLTDEPSNEIVKRSLPVINLHLKQKGEYQRLPTLTPRLKPPFISLAESAEDVSESSSDESGEEGCSEDGTEGEEGIGDDSSDGESDGLSSDESEDGESAKDNGTPLDNGVTIEEPQSQPSAMENATGATQPVPNMHGDLRNLVDMLASES